MAGRFSISATFSAVDQLTAPIRRMQARMQKFTEGAERQGKRLSALSGGVDRVHGAFTKFGVAGVAAAGAVGVAVADVVRIGADFEQTLTNAAAKFPDHVTAGTEAFARLEVAAKNVGATTEFTASQAAQALDFLAMAGFNVEQSISALPGVVDLATAAGMDLGRATDIASDALGAFGLSTKDPIQLAKNLARVNDVLAKTSTSSNTTIEAMFEAMKEAGPVGTSVGASLETVSSLIGTLANAGIKGSVAGTTLKNVFTNLSAPTRQAAEALKKLGIKTKDSSGNVRDVVGVFGDLKKSLDGMGTADRAKYIEQIFGKIPLAGVNVLLDQGAGKLDEYRKSLEGAGGAAERMAEQMRNTTEGKLKGLSSAFEALKLEAFEAIKKPLGEIVDKTTAWARENKAVIGKKFTEALAFMRDTLPLIIDKAARIGVLAGTFYAVAAAIKFASLAVAAFNIAASFGPWGLWIAGIGLLIAALYVFWPEISAWLAKVWEGAKQLWDDVKYFFGDMLGPAIAEGFSSVVTYIADIASSAWNGLTAVWNGAGAYFGDVASSAWNALTAIWDGAGEYFRNLGTVAFGWLVDLGSGAVDSLMDVFSTLTSFFSSLWEGIQAGFEAFFAPVESALAGVSGMLGVDGGGGGAFATAGAPATPNVYSAKHETVSTVRDIQDLRGEITVRAEPGTEATIATPKRGRAIAMRMPASGRV